MSDLLSIGASGVRTYQTALTTVADNVANASTAGYTRKSATIREVSSATSIQGSLTLNGSIATGITRASDQYKSADVRQTSADLASTETSVSWLGRIETALSGNQLSTRVTAFFTAGQSLAADPTSTAARSTMLESATSAASAFKATGQALDQIASDLDSTGDSAVASLNGLSASLAKINQGLGKVAQDSAGAAQLLDQRDSVLEQMSALTDVSVSTDSIGRASVKMGGSTGPVLVDGTNAGVVTYVRNSSGTVSYAVHLNAESNLATPTGGALAGIADSAQKIVEARAEINRVATAFTTDVNAVQAQGQTLDGTAGSAMFATGATPTDISVVLTDPRGIAAATVGGGTTSNGNLAALQTARTAGNYEGALSSLTTTNAATLSARSDIATAQSAIRDSAVAARDSVSGVTLDDEAVDLLKFQQAYQASSRVIQAAREIFQSILDIR
jgi:flagellar hook-associated protein 1 FlgK